MTTCTKCRAEVAADAAFCGSCGAPVVAEAPAAGAAPAKGTMMAPLEVVDVDLSPLESARRNPTPIHESVLDAPHDTESSAPPVEASPSAEQSAEAPILLVPAAPAGAVPAPRTVPAAPISAAMKPVAAAAPPAPAAQEAPKVPVKQHLAAGTIVDQKYSVVRVLGEGGMGVVYLARDVHTGLDVVIKAIRTELSHRADVRQRTLSEGRALARIDHPNVVRLNAVVVEDNNLFLVMQYIEGESLDRTIFRHTKKNEKIPLGAALAIFRQVVAGIGAAHAEGVIHRDLKPANVLIRTKDKVAKVTDFGIAKVQNDTSRVQTRGIIGSLWYMSPEQVTGRRDLDQRVDIYALGILLYQILVGRVPFDAKSDYEIMKLHAEAPMPKVAAERPDAPAAIDELIQKACAKNRDQRYQTCDDLAQAVDKVIAKFVDDAEAPPRSLAPTLPSPEELAEKKRADEESRRAATKTGEEDTPKKRSVWPWIVVVLLLAGGTVAALAWLKIIRLPFLPI